MDEFDDIGTETGPPVRRVGAILAVVVLAAVAVFSLGVMVGKRVTETVPLILEPPSSLPTENLAALRPESAAKGAEDTQREVTGAGENAKEPLSSDKLTFFETLPNDKAPEPRAVPGEPVKTAKSAPRKPPAARPSPPTPAPNVKSLTGPGPFFVQISSTTNREWADDLIKRLKKGGVEAKPTSVKLNGKQWYRIRVGSFPNREKAERAQVLLKKMGHDGMIVRGD